jgi:hypothetical protein
MPAPLLSMYNGGAGCGVVARFQRDLPATPRPAQRRYQATEFVNLSSRPAAIKHREL